MRNLKFLFLTRCKVLDFLKLQLQRFDIPAEKISEQASLSGDLNLCGVSLLVFLRLCEKEYNVRMPEEVAFYAREFGYVLTNVGELATLLYEAVKKA